MSTTKNRATSPKRRRKDLTGGTTNRERSNSAKRSTRMKQKKKGRARDRLNLTKVQAFRRRAKELKYDPDHAAKFFKEVKTYRPICRAVIQGKFAYRRLFLEAYRVIAGIADHLDTPEFSQALHRYADPPKGGSRDPEFLVLRLIFDYEAEARTLQGEDRVRERKNGLKKASRDAAAVRCLLNEGRSPPAAAALFDQPGEGLAAWAARAPARRAKKGAARRPARIPAPACVGVPDDLDGLKVTSFPCMQAIDPNRDLVGVMQVDRDGSVRGFRSFGKCARFLSDKGASLLKDELDGLPLKQ